MNTASLRALTLPGAALIALMGLGISLFILLGDPQLAPRVWIASILMGVAVVSVWQMSRAGRLSPRRTDMAMWAILIGHTVLVARIRDPRALAEGGGLTAEIYVEIGIWLAVILYAVGRLSSRLHLLYNFWGPSSRFATLLFLAALGSILVSVDAGITAAWVLKLLSILLMAGVLLDNSDPLATAENFLRATYLGLLLMLAQFLALGVLSPAAAMDRSRVTGILRAGGYLLPATQLSTIAGMVLVLALADRLAKRPGRLSRTVIVVSAALLLASVGRSGIFSTCLAIALLLAFYRRLLKAALITVAAGVILALLPDLLELSRDFIARGQTEQEIAGLTGRVKLWKTAIDLFWERPLFGWGYVSGSRVGLLHAFRGWAAAHSHNALLEILLGMGLSGAVVLVALLYRTCRGAAKRLLPTMRASADDPSSVMASKLIAILVLMTSDSIMTAGFGGAPRFETTILIGCAFCADQLARIGEGAS